ncbi:hypothetical protein A0J61_08266 [Choanephora cucurbitarum]|uniref:Uncharacterized protein n=1 Tax=Choanephora cucurbitarum TaxID=101091 RepID=A0A1C7N3I9_9FUNG|nr:hypothetical protein A0J61_08266 [Choanephora cucurbitarum]
MDLSWCIICDSRIPDEWMMANNSLYCSQECRQKDDVKTETLKPWMTRKSTARHHLYRTVAPTTAYPWVPLYRKRRGSAVLRCIVQPSSHLIR